MGEKERDGKKLFVPGDVPPSDQLQKRTASYAVQSLVMGARKDGKAYNSARYSVPFPHAEQNKKRGIPVSEIRKRHAVDTEPTTVAAIRTEEMTLYYVYNLQESTVSLFNMNTEEMIPLSEPVSTETTIKHFGKMSQLPFDITLTLQTTSMSIISLTYRMVRFSYLAMFLRRWGGPISAVIRVSPDEYSTVQSLLKESRFPSRLVVSVVIDAGEDYPINFLRNAAIRAAATSHFFVCDMDVWPLRPPFPPFFTPRVRLHHDGRNHGERQRRRFRSAKWENRGYHPCLRVCRSVQFLQDMCPPVRFPSFFDT